MTDKLTIALLIAGAKAVNFKTECPFGHSSSSTDGKLSQIS